MLDEKEYGPLLTCALKALGEVVKNESRKKNVDEEYNS